MKAKFVAAVLMPVVVVILVAGILNWTHHTTVPPLVLPERIGSVPSSGPVAVTKKTCDGKVPTRFAGIAVKSDPAGTTAQYMQLTDSRPAVVEFYSDFKNPFPAWEANQALSANEVPLIQLNPRHVSLPQITDGRYDAHLKAYATMVKSFACTIILSFGHEMNGWWYPWGYPDTTPKEFIAAWQHIHDLFQREGVTNVLWSWDPSHQYQPVKGHPGLAATPASEWYPGRKYVDLIGLDGYLGSEKDSRRPQTFAEIFRPQLRYIRQVAPHKPVYLAETGVAPGRAAAHQIRELFAGILSNHLAGLLWFDAEGKNSDYRLGTHAGDDAVYKEALAGYLSEQAG